jgi:flagellar biosynthesis protein FlhF
MRVLKFEGATMRDAIAKVKAELGDQAVIISTRQVRRGLLGSAVEISAAIETDDDEAPPFASGPAAPPTPPPPAGPRTEQLVEAQVAPLRSELRSLRALVRNAGETRGTIELRSEVAALKKLIEQLQAAGPPAPAPRLPTRADVALTAPSEARAIMLVGPTGAGKTTTIAKLAARAALIDQRQVAVITLDNYRVGGVDQIRTFTDLIGVPLQVADHAGELAERIDPATDLTLIDTAGKSPRDQAAIEELAAQIDGLGIEVHLVIPASATAAQIDQLVARYASLAPARLLFTKLDEHDHVPELALAPARAGIPITWVTTGQAVPEDIEEPSPARVLELASSGLAHPGTRPHTTRAA